MKKLTTLLLIALSGLNLPLHAEEPPAATGWAASTTTVSLGYDSRYLLYGYRLSRHLYHVDTYTSLPLANHFSAWFGGWYGYLADGSYHEVDAYGGVDRALTPNLSMGLAYSLFNYLEVPYESNDRSHEFAGHVTGVYGPLTLMVRDQYDTEGQGHLLRLVGTLSRSLNNSVSAALSAEYGYAFDYYIDGNEPNHTLFTLKLPVGVGKQWLVTPSVNHSIPLEAIEAFEEEDTIYRLVLAYTF